MGILGFLLLGLIAGAIAKLLMPGDDRGGIFVTMLLGVVGAVLGGFLGSLLLDTNVMDEFFDVSTWVSAIVGSLVVLAAYRAVAGRSDDRSVTRR